MCTQKKLDELFISWRNAQEVVNHDRNVLNNPAYVFTPDGLIGDEATYEMSSPKKVLYVLQESHLNHAGLRPNTKFESWAKKLDMSNQIMQRLQGMQEIIMKSDNVSLKSAAYMNINKNGNRMDNGSSVYWPQFNKYAKLFSQFVKEEIRILSPEYIVCCGTYDTVINIIGDEGNNIIIVDMIHPSGVSGKNKICYLQKFRTRLEEAEKKHL